jgi:hypothetical protein
MITDKELKEYEVTHDHGGNGFVMVENLDEEYCRISGVSNKDVDNRAYLAWKKKLRVSEHREDKDSPLQRKRIPIAALDKVCQLRNALLAGTKKVVQTHIVNPEQPELIP